MATYITEDEEMLRAQYEIWVLEAKSVHGLMLRESFQTLIRAKLAYEAQKREADELYLASRRKLFNKLRKMLYNLSVDEEKALTTAERMNEHVDGPGKDHPGSVTRRTSNERMAESDSTSG